VPFGEDLHAVPVSVRARSRPNKEGTRRAVMWWLNWVFLSHRTARVRAQESPQNISTSLVVSANSLVQCGSSRCSRVLHDLLQAFQVAFTEGNAFIQ
jgi:hypothetical protein